MENSGKGIAVVALIIALGAIGLGTYQVITMTVSPEGPKTYIVSNENAIALSSSGWTDIPNLNIEYNTKAGGLVLLEFNCQLGLNIVTATIYMKICFVIDSILLSSTSYIYVFGSLAVDPQDIFDSALMRHYISSSAAGAHNVSIRVYMDDPGSTSFVRFNVLMVEIY